MKKVFSNTLVSALLAASLVSVSSVEAAANNAANAAPKKKLNVDVSTRYTKSCRSLAATKPPEKRVLRALTESVHKRLNKALGLLSKEQHQEALDMMLALANRNKSNAYTLATINLNINYAYSNLNQIAQSIRYLEKVVAAKVLPWEREQSARLQLANLYYGEDNHKKSLEHLRAWFKNETNPKVQGYVLMAANFSAQNKLKEAICPAYLAIKESTKANKNIFGVLLNSHYELNDIPGSIKILTVMVELFPQETIYWRNLAGLYAKSERHRDSLAVMELLHRQKRFNKPADYKQLSSFYAMLDVPYKSAEVLQEGIEKEVVESNEKNWKNVASNFHVAQEIDKSIYAYKKAAEYVDNGRHDLKQAQLYGEAEKWKLAVKAYDKALQRGGLKDPGEAYFGKADALYNDGNFPGAISAFEQAAKYKNFKKNSNRWISFIRDRIEKLRRMAEGV
ncbi:tetratricopeptide repeat protein [Pleionea sp. CnH1-48]|uniref:tetratricopeptide repeat protein n=1 Tax=Pleionea sp. CnH1-48 TaxID=2954494 RepID=UPI00209760A7|nr:tetratricopeptide repeat protein [Pleionea sp. CnH1-48]MCO7225437.1 tetratricopeptide repeat protein [Pleionea sp. CnH1-48]